MMMSDSKESDRDKNNETNTKTRQCTNHCTVALRTKKIENHAYDFSLLTNHEPEALVSCREIVIA